jgi:hypothetical protein
MLNPGIITNTDEHITPDSTVFLICEGRKPEEFDTKAQRRDYFLYCFSFAFAPLR